MNSFYYIWQVFLPKITYKPHHEKIDLKIQNIIYLNM